MINKVLVTGCSQGLGRAIALKLAEKNCRVYAVGRNEKLLTELSKTSSLIQPIAADIATEAGRQAIFSQVDQSTPFSVIHNAAISKPSLIQVLSEKLLREHFEINYFAPLFITQHFLSSFTTGQRVLHISSGAADLARPGSMPYCTSKALLEHTTKCLNAEFNDRGIYFANLRPGMIDTAMQANLRNSELLPDRDFYVQAAKDNKLAPPEIVAAFVAAVLLNTSDSDFSEKLWNIADPSHHKIAS
jgi:3-oxoacyl-[acyl-carrier protein] reductase